MELIEPWLRKRDVIQYSLRLRFRASRRWGNKEKDKRKKKSHARAAKRIVESETSARLGSFRSYRAKRGELNVNRATRQQGNSFLCIPIRYISADFRNPRRRLDIKESIKLHVLNGKWNEGSICEI